MSFAEIYKGWRERLQKLSAGELYFLAMKYEEWTGERVEVDATNENWHGKFIETVLDMDPILTDDGLAGFMEAYVPK